MSNKFKKLASIPTAEPFYRSLEVDDGGGDKVVVPLTGDRSLIGRGREAQIRLEGDGVSRLHAELFRDPFGRWWIRDLDSSNGTNVNGFEVAERMLELDDVITIGGYTLSLTATDTVPAQEPEMAGPGVTMRQMRSDHISSLTPAAAPQISAAHLDTLMTLSRRLQSIESLGRRRELLCSMMVSEQFGGLSAVVIRLDRADPAKDPQTLCTPQTSPAWRGQSLYISAELVESLCGEPQPLLTRDIEPGAALVAQSAPATAEAAAMSAMACPLEVVTAALDVLYVIVPPSHGTMQWLTLVKLAAELFNQAQITWQARRLAHINAMVEHDLNRGREIQMRLIPRNVRVQDLDVAVRFQPCRWVAGDYVDVVSAPGSSRTLLIVADVCGKGLPAALVASSVHTMVHTFMRAGVELQGLVAMINEHLFDHLPANRFVTGVFVQIDPATGELNYINAGHPSPIIVQPDGQRRELSISHDEPLGLTRVTYQLEHDQLDRGQMLAMFTDGLTEMKDASGRMLTDYRVGDHLRQIFSADPQAPTEQAAQKFNEVLDAYQGDRLQADDRTFLLARRT